MRYSRKERFNEEIELHRLANFFCPEASGNRYTCRRYHPKDGNQRTDFLPVEEEVCWTTAQRTETVAAARR